MMILLPVRLVAHRTEIALPNEHRTETKWALARLHPKPGTPGGHTGPPRGRATRVRLVVPACGRRLWCEVSAKVRQEAQVPSQGTERRAPDGTGQHCGVQDINKG